LILEMAAHVNLGKDLTVLAKHGRVVVIGSRGPVEINPRDGMARDADIRPMTLMNATEAQLNGIHAALIAGLEIGSLHPVIGKESPLAEAARAHRSYWQGKRPNRRPIKRRQPDPGTTRKLGRIDFVRVPNFTK
jgi:NADPH2:quinone reductase